MTCCFAVVCKDCVGVSSGHVPSAASTRPADSQDGTTLEENKEEPAKKTESKSNKICLACLEPIPADVSGVKPLTIEK